MADVFLSYAREDRARAEQVATALAARGYDVFWDATIPPGKTWADVVEAKLAAAKTVIVLWSATSIASRWVREEARLARDQGKLLPALIETVPQPFGFGEIQAADLHAWNGEDDDAQWQLLLSSVGATVATPHADTASTEPARQPITMPLRATRRRWRLPRIFSWRIFSWPIFTWRRAAVLVFALIAVGGMAAYLDRDTGSRGTPSEATLSETKPSVPPPSDTGAEPNYADEFTDFGVPPQLKLQSNVSSETPRVIPWAKVVTTRDVRSVHVGGEVLLIDVLPDGPAGKPAWPPVNRHPTIPGAVRMPGMGDGGTFDDKIQQELRRRLAAVTDKDFDRIIIFFCMGARCWESYNATLRAVRLGYRRVYWYRGGLSAWQEAGYPVE